MRNGLASESLILQLGNKIAVVVMMSGCFEIDAASIAPIYFNVDIGFCRIHSEGASTFVLLFSV